MDVVLKINTVFPETPSGCQHNSQHGLCMSKCLFLSLGRILQQMHGRADLIYGRKNINYYRQNAINKMMNIVKISCQSERHWLFVSFPETFLSKLPIFSFKADRTCIKHERSKFSSIAGSLELSWKHLLIIPANGNLLQNDTKFERERHRFESFALFRWE